MICQNKNDNFDMKKAITNSLAIIAVGLLINLAYAFLQAGWRDTQTPEVVKMGGIDLRELEITK